MEEVFYSQSKIIILTNTTFFSRMCSSVCVVVLVKKYRCARKYNFSSPYFENVYYFILARLQVKMIGQSFALSLISTINFNI